MVTLFHLECLLEGRELFLARILHNAIVRTLIDLCWNSAQVSPRRHEECNGEKREKRRTAISFPIIKTWFHGTAVAHLDATGTLFLREYDRKKFYHCTT
jgi:hypothetical protein